MVDESLSWMDAAFWHLDSPTAPMHLGALPVFEPADPLEPSEITRLVRERAATASFLRRKVVTGWNPLAGPRWEEDPAFDAARHVHLHQVDGGCGAEVLERWAAEVMAVPLNPHLPPWEIHILTGSGRAAGDHRFAMLFKAHHAAVDGLRAVEVGARLLDQCQESSAGTRRLKPRPGRPAPGRPRTPGRLGLPIDPRPVLDSLAGPTGQLLHGARLATSVATTCLQAALRPGPNPLHASPGGRPRLALSMLALDEVHRVRKEHGGTVNDILLTVIAGALRRWLLERGQEPAPGVARVLVPVSSRIPAASGGRRNQLSGYLLDLPVCLDNPLDRLRAVHEAMQGHKERGPRQGPGAVALLADLAPPLTQRIAAPLLRQSAPLLFDALVTNVPVLDVPLSLAGAPMRRLYPIAPLARGHALAIAMTTYRNTVHLGVHAAGGTDPGLLVDAARGSLTELLGISG